MSSRPKPQRHSSIRQAAEALMQRLDPEFKPSLRPKPLEAVEVSNIPLPPSKSENPMKEDDEVQIIEPENKNGSGTQPLDQGASSSKDFVSDYPAFESFDNNISASSAMIKFEADARIGDLIYVRVKKCDAAGAYVKPLCYAKRIKRDLEWLNIQIITPLSALDRRVSIGEYILAKIVAIRPVQIALQLQASTPQMTDKALPKYFREVRELGSSGSSSTSSSSASLPYFWAYMEERPDTRNPYLETILGMPERSVHSLLQINCLDQDRLETAAILRKRQDAELAMQSVGVEAMKSGNRLGALQHFNHALSIDEKCVDALVARGAAYSNDGHFAKAEEDFDKALSIQPDHQNAKIYMVETLISHANLIEIKDENELALQKFEKALRLKEDRRARQGLEKIRNKKRKPSSSIEREAKRRREEEMQRERKERQREEEKSRRMKEEDKKKLAEMEDFIKALKNGKK